MEQLHAAPVDTDLGAVTPRQGSLQGREQLVCLTAHGTLKNVSSLSSMYLMFSHQKSKKLRISIYLFLF